MDGYFQEIDYERKIYNSIRFENLEHFKDGWNGNDKDDRENIEWYLTDIQGHRLSNIEWMLHDDKEIIEQNPHGENGILF